MQGLVEVQGSGNAGETEVIVDDQTATPDKLKIGMRAQVVFYTYMDPSSKKGGKMNLMKSVKAISRGKQEPAK